MPARDALSVLDLPERLREGIPSVVVLAGEETFLADEAVEALRRARFPDGDPPGGVTRVEADDASHADRLAAVADDLATPSLFGEGRLVIVRGFGGGAAAAAPAAAAIASDAEDEDGEAAEDEPRAGPARPASRAGAPRSPLLSLVTTVARAAVPGATLAIATRRPVKGRGAVPLASLAKAGALVVDCRPLYDSVPPWSRGTAAHETEVARWLSKRARAVHGKAMDLRAAHALAQRRGGGLAALASALETLAAYVGDRKGIGEADVAETVAKVREEAAYGIADAVVEGDLAGALERLDAAFDRGLVDPRGRSVTRPEALFALLFFAVQTGWRRAMLVAEAAARGEDPTASPALAGLPRFVVERAVGQARRRDVNDLLARHGAFVDAEVGVRGGGVPPHVALTRLFVALAGPAPRGVGRSP